MRKIILPLSEEVLKRISLNAQAGYISPLSGRYCSPIAKYIVSEEFRWTQARKVWLAVLKSQIDLGLIPNPPKEKTLRKFEDKISKFDWDRIKTIEKETKHDVKAHIEYVGEMIPDLAGKIHVGMTSEDAVSNGETIMNQYWIQHTLNNLYTFIKAADKIILKYKAIAVLGETHLQPATATTMGKRIAMWLGPVLEDFHALVKLSKKYKTIKGVRGATGTYGALLELCDNDVNKIIEFEKKLSKYLDVKITKLVPGQTAPRSWDNELVFRFASIAANLGKMATDIRHMAENGEVGEPRGKNQVGSSAMPHKRNPMKNERINALSRLTIGYMNNALMTQHIQGLERTLDDSAGRRIYMPESFLNVDSILILAVEVIAGLEVYEPICKNNLKLQLPFLVGENVLMKAVKQGISREKAHSFFRIQAMAVYEDIANGKITKNDLFERLKVEGSPFKNMELPDLSDTSNFVGLSVKLCEDFSKHINKKVIKKYDFESEVIKTLV
jgi:adenylosuccinate lyase